MRNAVDTKNIVVIGGGTGSYTVLSGLKKFAYPLTSIVSMMDSGGSSGRLRDEFGILPPGDIRQSLVALSQDTSALRKLFTYRFDKGNGLVGHNFGNLFLTALADIYGDMSLAVERAGRILNIKGSVLPVTTDNAQLVAEYSDGAVVVGEHFIDEPDIEKEVQISKVSLRPDAQVYPKAALAIEEADLIILGPGDLYTSTIPNLLVTGVKEAILESKAKVVYVVNLMTKLGQTRGLTAANCVSEIERYLHIDEKAKKKIDFVLINNSPLPKEILKKYEIENDFPIKDDLNGDYQVVRADFLAEDEIKKDKTDTLKRSLIRHDSAKLAEALVSLINGQEG